MAPTAGLEPVSCGITELLGLIQAACLEALRSPPHATDAAARRLVELLSTHLPPNMAEDWPLGDTPCGPLADHGPIVGRVSANEVAQKAPDSRAEAGEGSRTDALRLGQASANHRPSDHRADGRRP